MKTHYFVAVNTKFPAGCALTHDWRSRQIERVGTLLRVLKRVRRGIPHAFAIEVRQYR